MTSRALNDEQAQNEMKKMIAFIKQEALEKAKEIKIKADEEFNIEKAKFVRQETANIDALFQKKIKQAEVQRKIAASNFYNKSKLRVLQLRDDLLNNLNQQSRRKLEAFTQQQEAYRGLMKQLLIQGIYECLESEITIRCREQDSSLLESIMSEVKSETQKKLKMEFQLTLDKSNWLPDSIIGGLNCYTYHGRITVLNTLEARLETCLQELLPTIRVMLYGIPANRRFFE
ncbi:hypothetical protein HMI55_000326 [Coelomomyces lativittatus]|nr:hypothetical protein HMI55_000326 [Coelomomyces lativittatus]KAJ1511182.1 hypothetical protein HMI56_005710 [Coelomomyces lativittatus]